MFSSPTGSIYVSSPENFWDMRGDICEDLLEAPVIHGARWQTLDVSQSDAHATRELLNVTLWYDMPQTRDAALVHINPDMPWAEGHFLERVGGQPVNPGEWHDKWPYHAGKVDLHQKGGKYDHNYMERYWATKVPDQYCSRIEGVAMPFHGYRFPVGDLGDVVRQLRDEPTTRQAYLPVWFPEDTGATSGQRVPCTLGYHFIIRSGQLHIQYNIRSCDIYRHFTNDVYMTVRLAQWIADKLGLELGQLTMHVVSLHMFLGDQEKVEDWT